MDVNGCMQKLMQITRRLFGEDLVLTVDDIEHLVKLLEDGCSDVINPAKSLLESPQFSDLLITSLGNIHNANTSTKIFIVRIAAVFLRNDLQFNRTPIQVLLNSCIKCLRTYLDAQDIPTSLHLAYLKLATSLIPQRSGVMLIMEHKLYKVILPSNIHHKVAPVARAAYNFISKLTWKLSDYKLECYVTEVLEFVIMPIKNTGFKNVTTIDSEAEKVLTNEIYSNFNALQAILRETDKLVAINKVTRTLKHLVYCEPGMHMILDLCRNPDTIYLVNDCAVRTALAILATRHLHEGNTQNYCTEVLAGFRNGVSPYIHRDTILTLRLVVNWNVILSDFKKSYQTVGLPCDTTFERNGQNYNLDHQTIMLIMTPLITYSALQKKYKDQDLIEIFRSKMGKIILEHIFSCGYLMKSTLLRHNLEPTVIQTLRELFLLRGRISAAQAGILFQGLFYMLHNFIMLDDAGGLILNENPTKCPDDIKLLTLVLDGIKMLLVDHNIHWYEIVEITNLQAGLLNILKQNTLTIKQTIQVLDLIDICVKKFLSPNMTLLVEARQDSTLNEIGAAIKNNIQHEDWGVRDSALNLLLSCTDISFVKYIPLQRVIIENNLMIYAAKFSLTDPDFYPQSTALKCMATACKIGNIWRDVLNDNPHFYLQLVYILQHNAESVVRKEAAQTLTRIYDNQKLSQSFKSTLYEVMINQALDDLDCEVQLAALHFWRQVIQTHLTYRGMIDGKFPSVTFSKEKRKIVILNDREIIRQLTGIMEDLSSIGCLTVLLKSMDEINTVEVMEEAYKMSKELIKTLDQYKFVTKGAETAETQRCRVKDEPMAEDFDVCIDDDRDKVIDSILDLSQNDLLINLHDNVCKTDETYEDKMYVPRRDIVKPSTFLEAFKQTDFISQINLKKNFDINLGNLDTLLDEILHYN